MLNLYCKKNEVLSFSNSHQEIGGDWGLKENSLLVTYGFGWFEGWSAGFFNFSKIFQLLNKSFWNSPWDSFCFGILSLCQ